MPAALLAEGRDMTGKELCVSFPRICWQANNICHLRSLWNEYGQRKCRDANWRMLHGCEAAHRKVICRAESQGSQSSNWFIEKLAEHATESDITLWQKILQFIVKDELIWITHMMLWVKMLSIICNIPFESPVDRLSGSVFTGLDPQAWKKL